jgi:hypothetical protein
MGTVEKEGPEEQKTSRSGAPGIFCQRCAGKIIADEASWEEDREVFLCRDCAAENDSCGCSD